MKSAQVIGIGRTLQIDSSKLIQPLMTEAALSNLSMVGNVLIFCVGVNLLWDKRIRVANLLPAVLIAVIAAFF